MNPNLNLENENNINNVNNNDYKKNVNKLLLLLYTERNKFLTFKIYIKYN